MTTPLIDQARADAAEGMKLAEKATDGPWDTDGYASVIAANGEVVVTAPCYESQDQQLRDDIFIADARFRVPILAAHVTALADEVEQHEEAITTAIAREREDIESLRTAIDYALEESEDGLVWLRDWRDGFNDDLPISRVGTEDGHD